MIYIEITTIADLADRLARTRELLDSCAVVQTEPATYRALIDARKELIDAERDVLQMAAAEAKREQYLATIPESDDLAELFGGATVGGMIQ